MNEPPKPAENKPNRAFRFLSTAIVVVLVSALGAALYVASQATEHSPAKPRIGRNAPFITSPDNIVEKMVELAKLTPDDLVYDLGCGDGRIVITAALKSGCKGVGFDIDPERVAEARENVKLHGVEHLVEIRQADVFTVDLEPANAVLFYLLPWMNRKLIPQFQQMKPGSRLVSHDFPLGDIIDLPADETAIVKIEEPPPSDHYVYRWNIPLTVPAAPRP